MKIIKRAPVMSVRYRYHPDDFAQAIEEWARKVSTTQTAPAIYTAKYWLGNGNICDVSFELVQPGIGKDTNGDEWVYGRLAYKEPVIETIHAWDTILDLFRDNADSMFFRSIIDYVFEHKGGPIYDQENNPNWFNRMIDGWFYQFYLNERVYHGYLDGGDCSNDVFYIIEKDHSILDRMWSYDNDESYRSWFALIKMKAMLDN